MYYFAEATATGADWQDVLMTLGMLAFWAFMLWIMTKD